MMLPYTTEVYFASMAGYNDAWLPVVLIAVLLAGAALGCAVRPPNGRATVCGRFVGGFLAAAAIWIGALHQLRLMASLDFLAPVYGGAWILQAVLIAAVVVVRGGVTFRLSGDARGRSGLALAVLGLIGYPLVVLALGHEWRAVPVVGMAPDPTAIFMAGLLLAARPWPPLLLFVVPVAWAGVAAVSGYLLRFPLDYVVALAVAAAVVPAVAVRLRK